MQDLVERVDEIEKELKKLSSFSDPTLENQISPSSDEIDLLELWSVIWAGKWIIAATTFVFAVASVVYALWLPNIYRSEVLLAPAEENTGGGLAGMAGQLGGLAGLAGVNLGGGGRDKTMLALEVLKSREFISHFIEKHDLLVPLMAAKGWDSKTDELIFDSDVYDVQAGEWVRNVAPPKKLVPSNQEAYEVFHQFLSISQDKETFFVSLGVEFFSPKVAKQWVDWLVEDINLRLKARDVAEAERSIKYLSNQLDKTPVADMRAIFYELIEEQTKTIMFAEGRKEYAFSTIDGAVAPELRSNPNRVLICIIITFFGAVLGVAVSFIYYFFGGAMSNGPKIYSRYSCS